MQGDAPTPRYALVRETLVYDVKNSRQLMWIDGVLPLPVGAEIELVNPNVSATVVRVRLLAAPTPSDPVRLCLDVEVPE